MKILILYLILLPLSSYAQFNSGEKISAQGFNDVLTNVKNKIGKDFIFAASQSHVSLGNFTARKTGVIPSNTLRIIIPEKGKYLILSHSRIWGLINSDSWWESLIYKNTSTLLFRSFGVNAPTGSNYDTTTSTFSVQDLNQGDVLTLGFYVEGTGNSVIQTGDANGGSSLIAIKISEVNSENKLPLEISSVANGSKITSEYFNSVLEKINFYNKTEKQFLFHQAANSEKTLGGIFNETGASVVVPSSGKYLILSSLRIYDLHITSNNWWKWRVFNSTKNKEEYEVFGINQESVSGTNADVQKSGFFISELEAGDVLRVQSFVEGINFKHQVIDPKILIMKIEESPLTTQVNSGENVSETLINNLFTKLVDSSLLLGKVESSLANLASEQGQSHTTVNSWFSPATRRKVIVPEDGTYLILAHTRLYDIGDHGWWTSRIFNETKNTVIFPIFGYNPVNSGNGDITTSGYQVVDLQKNDVVSFQYWVQKDASGASYGRLGNGDGSHSLILLKLK